MKILVTGCAGFIGFHLTRRLLSEGHEVIGIDNLNNYYSLQLKLDRLEHLKINTKDITPHHRIETTEGFTFIKASIEEQALFHSILNDSKFDAVCHLAAQAGVRYSIENPESYISSNLCGFFNILEYCRKRPEMKLVFASSSSVYGKSASVPYKEEDSTDAPVSLYAATKKSNELMAYSYSELYGIEAIGLRFFTVYGPWGRPDMAPYIFTNSIFNSEVVRLFNHGEMMRDFTYIDDIIEGVHLVLLNNANAGVFDEGHFKIYNIGNSNPMKLEDFISTLETISGKKADRIYLPMQPGDVKETWADITSLNNDYGYSPKTDVETGLGAFVDWYKEYYRK